MSKMTKKMRCAVFMNAINKLYGERITSEKEEFQKGMENVLLEMTKRIAKGNGVDYNDLITKYKPYVETRNSFHFQTKKDRFTDELNQIFYNEHHGVLIFEDADFDLVRMYKDQYVYCYSSENYYPATDDHSFTEDERKEIITIFKKYASFMDDVITSACAIRDVINSATTTKQLAETSPELGALIPETEYCTALVPVETVKKVSALFSGK